MVYEDYIETDELFSFALWNKVMIPIEMATIAIMLWTSNKKKLQSNDVKTIANFILAIIISWTVIGPFVDAILKGEKNVLICKFFENLSQHFFFCIRLVLQNVLMARQKFLSIFMASSIGSIIEFGVFNLITRIEFITSSIYSFILMAKLVSESALLALQLIIIVYRSAIIKEDGKDKTDMEIDDFKNGKDMWCNDKGKIFYFTILIIFYCFIINR